MSIVRWKSAALKESATRCAVKTANVATERFVMEEFVQVDVGRIQIVRRMNHVSIDNARVRRI